MVLVVTHRIDGTEHDLIGGIDLVEPVSPCQARTEARRQVSGSEAETLPPMPRNAIRPRDPR